MRTKHYDTHVNKSLHASHSGLKLMMLKKKHELARKRCIADFRIRGLSEKFESSADLEVGDTAGLETCATF